PPPVSEVAAEEKAEREPVEPEAEKREPVAAAEAAPPRTDDFDRRGGRRRDRDRDGRDRDRDRDRRGKKPKIPSFEGRSFEPREDRPERTFGSIEVIPGETLAKYSRSEKRPQRAEDELHQQLAETGVDASAVEGTVPDLSHDTERD